MNILDMSRNVIMDMERCMDQQLIYNDMGIMGKGKAVHARLSMGKRNSILNCLIFVVDDSVKNNKKKNFKEEIVI